MTHDGADKAEFGLTQEFLAEMLAALPLPVPQSSAEKIRRNKAAKWEEPPAESRTSHAG